MTSTNTRPAIALPEIVISEPIALDDAPARIWVSGHTDAHPLHIGDVIGTWHPCTGHLTEMRVEEIHFDADGQPVALFGTSDEGHGILVDAIAEYVA
ncbi:hypothetical protein ACIBG8_54600 [Nonomuraea sp. NPDC050556]|uniref:hypothetical protein n=1 Tax=Nonomuraea sp. NPDC050556 TaxID=3364369 RepID=UPI0037B36D9D